MPYTLHENNPVPASSRVVTHDFEIVPLSPVLINGGFVFLDQRFISIRVDSKDTLI
jgi:hypothetical protein